MQEEKGVNPGPAAPGDKCNGEQVLDSTVLDILIIMTKLLNSDYMRGVQSALL